MHTFLGSLLLVLMLGISTPYLACADPTDSSALPSAPIEVVSRKLWVVVRFAFGRESSGVKDFDKPFQFGPPSTITSQEHASIGIVYDLGGEASIGLDIGHASLKIDSDRGGSLTCTPALLLRTSRDAVLCLEFCLGVTFRNMTMTRFDGSTYGVGSVVFHGGIGPLVRIERKILFNAMIGQVYGYFGFAFGLGISIGT